MRAILLLGLVAGCGDDDGSNADADSDSDVDTDVDTDSDADTDSDSDSDTDVADCPGMTAELPGNVALEEDLIALVNEARGAGATCGGTPMPAVAALQPVQELRCASRAHARQMAADGMIEATAAADYQSRFADAGYFATRFTGTATEDAATAADAMEDWMGLSGSCELVMNGEYGDFGVGTAQGYWSIGLANR